MSHLMFNLFPVRRDLVVKVNKDRVMFTESFDVVDSDPTPPANTLTLTSYGWHTLVDSFARVDEAISQQKCIDEAARIDLGQGIALTYRFHNGEDRIDIRRWMEDYGADMGTIARSPRDFIGQPWQPTVLGFTLDVGAWIRLKGWASDIHETLYQHLEAFLHTTFQHCVAEGVLRGEPLAGLSLNDAAEAIHGSGQGEALCKAVKRRLAALPVLKIHPRYVDEFYKRVMDPHPLPEDWLEDGMMVDSPAR